MLVPRAGDARCIRQLRRPANAQTGGRNAVYSLIYKPDLFITRCVIVLNSLALLIS